MSDIQLYLVEFDRNRNEATAIAAQSAQRLQSKELKLSTLIESLAEYINHEEAATRAKTMSYVADVLQAVPSKVLTGQHRNLLCDFVLGRVSADTEGIGASAKSLLALESLGQWDQNRASEVMTTILEHTHPLEQYKDKNERYPIVLLIDMLMAKYRTAIHTLHDESPNFTSRLVSYFDGEKDPRNLMVVFSILRVAGAEWDMSAHAQEMFDASFNYFPITFRPPPDDPYGITSQDLKDRLRGCIASSSYFAPYAFPALLDKLDSASANTKRDVLQALLSCVQNYGPRTVNLYSITLWDALKFEILSVQEEDLAEKSLDVLEEIPRQLSRGSQDSMVLYLKPVAKECNEHLEDAPTKQSQGATRMLYAVCKSCAPASNFTITAILPHIFVLYQNSQDMSKRRALIETLTQVVKANSEVFGEWRRTEVPKSGNSEDVTPEKFNINGLTPFRNQILETLTGAFNAATIKQVSYRLILLDALVQVAKVRALLDDAQISAIIKLLDDVVLSEESYGKDDMKTAAINGLVEIAHQKPQPVIDNSFPAFLARLPDKDDQGPETYVPILEAFAKLGSEQTVFNTVVVRLKSKLNSAIQQKASATYLHAILSALLYAFSQDSCRFERSAYFEDPILPLVEKVCLETDDEQQNDTTMYLAGRLSNVILRGQTSHVQLSAQLPDEIYKLYSSAATGGNLVPVTPDTSQVVSRRLILSTYLLAAQRKDVPLSYDPSVLLKSMIESASSEKLTIGTRVAILQQISLTCNKFMPTSALKETLDPILYAPQNLLSTTTLTPTSIRIIFAILKALVLRNAPRLTGIFTFLTNALSDPQNGKNIAHGFATLLQPDEILTKENHCIISPLHKQKTFAILAPDIAQGIKDVDAELKGNYLIALAGIIRTLPFSVLEPQLPTLTPLLLQTLDLPSSADIKAGTIDTVSQILTERAEAIEEHTSSLISRLLNCAVGKVEFGNSAVVRAKALQCLLLVCGKVRTELVIPFRKSVVKRLIVACDDAKRSVRSEAVRCRAKWIEMDEAGDEDE
ncbi:MMS19 nucleotide excision repair protein-like protein [Venturia nashicola]|uniref:MMS19 nucleotide excision repair protein n=1 Tax=Venturia nashicola TaxID=86259 RepID=A0A4Z1NP60_9PEZI|nr:MMS19 nucleotide excision repair protein-like protein [Venturia nashicola]